MGKAQIQPNQWAELTDLEKWMAWQATKPKARQRLWPFVPERDRAMLMMRIGQAPPECGPMMGSAPARGELVPWMPKVNIPDMHGNGRTMDDGHRGWAAARVATAFDKIEGKRTKEARASGPLFNGTQIAAADDYAALTERVASAGVGCVSLEAVRVSGGGDGGFIEAVIADTSRLTAMHARIGNKVCKEVRRVRPSKRGTRVSIRTRALVDLVCLGGMTIGEVLEHHGWARDATTYGALINALAHALDRIAKVRG